MSGVAKCDAAFFGCMGTALSRVTAVRMAQQGWGCSSTGPEIFTASSSFLPPKAPHHAGKGGSSAPDVHMTVIKCFSYRSIPEQERSASQPCCDLSPASHCVSLCSSTLQEPIPAREDDGILQTQQCLWVQTDVLTLHRVPGMAPMPYVPLPGRHHSPHPHQTPTPSRIPL